MVLIRKKNKQKKPFLYSLKTKLIVALVVILIIPMSITLLYSVDSFSKYIKWQVEKTVEDGLTIVFMMHKGKEEDVRATARSIARDYPVILVTTWLNIGEQLAGHISKMIKENEIDMITITDAQGIVIARGSNPAVEGDDLSANSLVAEALRGNLVVATEIVGQEELLKEGLWERLRAAVPKEVPLDSALMIRAAAPIYMEDELSGVALVGCLVNNNFTITKGIENRVNFGIFQKERMVLTNLIDQQGKLILGEPIAPELAERIIKKGKPFLGKVTMGRKDYLGNYLPITDFEGKTIGALVAATSLETILMIKRNIMSGIIVISLGGLLLAVIISLYLTTGMTKSVKRLTEGATAISKGNLDYKIEVVTRDEIGELAYTFNRMTRDLKDSRKQLEDYSRTLVQRVEQRTKELQETQAQLFQSAKMAAVGQLGAGVAHELNNPLGGILGYAQLILRKLTRPDFNIEGFKDGLRKYLEGIESQTIRCKDIVEDLLLFTKKSILTRPQPVDIVNALQDTLAVVGHELELQNIQLATHFDKDLAPVMGDGNKLRQIFANIILNAQQAMPQGGQLTIRAENAIDEQTKKPNRIKISFTDTGCGIPPENLSRIFEPFFTTKRKDKSIGMGLHVCYKIIEDHGGHVEVKSRAGEGTTFIIFLPATEQNQNRPPS